jgi:hypothetical protein
MGMSPGFQQGAVAIVEMKVERQLLWRWFPHITPITAALLSRQKLDWHRALPFHMTRSKIYTYGAISANIPMKKSLRQFGRTFFC